MTSTAACCKSSGEDTPAVISPSLERQPLVGQAIAPVAVENVLASLPTTELRLLPADFASLLAPLAQSGILRI